MASKAPGLSAAARTSTPRNQIQRSPRRLSDVKYERADEEHILRGNWALGQSHGDFTFKVPAENLNLFWGEFGFQPGKTVGAWSGVRQPSGASKTLERSIR